MRAVCFVISAFGLAACAASVPSPEAVAPTPPASIPIRAPEAYSPRAEEREEPSDPRLANLCQTDPDACPPGPNEIRLTGPLVGAPAVRHTPADDAPLAVAQAAPAVPAAPPAPAPPAPIPVTPGADARPEQFDIEAKVHIEVKDIEKARAKLGALTRGVNGELMNEAVDNGLDRRGAALSLRVPSEWVYSFLDQLGQVGKVRSSTLETNDVSRKVVDAEVLVRNLEQTLHRYEELLAKAQNVSETMQVEEQLSRVRTELDRVRSDLAWQKDRVARATVYVTLSLEPEHPPLEETAKLHPGLRGTLFYDIVPADAPEGSGSYGGGGLSIAWPRAFSIDLDLMTSLKERGGDAIDFYIITLGTDLYSDFLGAGTRRFLNPYVGFRTGFAHAPNRPLFPLGGTLGLDLYKSSGVLIAIEGRAYALVGRKEGVDVGFEPAFAANFAY